MVVQGVMRWHGEGVGARPQAFGLREHLGDGANVALYVGGSPFGGADPLGLFMYIGTMVSTTEGLAARTANDSRLAGIVGATETTAVGGTFAQRFLMTLLQPNPATNAVLATVGAGIALTFKGDEGPQWYTVRIQAQGGGLEKSSVFHELYPCTVAEGLSRLEWVRSQLTRKQQVEREDCFRRAANFIRRGPPLGLRNPGRSFLAKGTKDVRVDVEILRGVNFVE